MKIKSLKLLSGVFALTTFSLLMAPAVIAATGTGQSAGPETPQQLVDLIGRIAYWFQGIVFAIAIIMIIYAGFLWITAAGDEDKLSNARRTLVWGLVGIAIVFFAYVAQSFVRGILGG